MAPEEPGERPGIHLHQLQGRLSARLEDTGDRLGGVAPVLRQNPVHFLDGCSSTVPIVLAPWASLGYPSAANG
jgi:hypothetical protein